MTGSDITPWRINLFGTLEISDPLGETRQIASRKGAELLAFLALRRTPIVERDVVAEALWPEADVFTARNRLKTTLAKMKHEVGGLPIIAHGKRHLELSRERVVIDYERCERRLKWRRSLSGRSRAAFAKQILEVTSRGLLPGIGATWIFAERDRYVALSRELERDLEDGGPGVTAGFRLGDELGGVEVPLIGRTSELGQIESWLSDPAGRTLNIVGMPGVGKTRLLKAALESALRVCDATITLSTVQASEVPWLDRLAQAMGIQNAGEVAKGLTQLLADYRHPLLVLDDLDQAGPEMRTWADQLMQTIPHLKLLGAARRRPPDPGIVICDLTTLATDDTKANSATELLVSFARHFGAKEQELSADREALGRIAEHLDGLPLALEIAAAWLPLIEPRTLSQKLRTSPELITRQPGAGRGSLADCVSAICNDLTPEDRDALVTLCLCHGGSGEALAEEMLGSDWVWRVRTLIDRSLALRVSGHAENRFVVVQALREAVLVVESEERVIRGRRTWRDACLSLGEKAYFEMNERDRRRWLLWLRDEGGNILAACSQTSHDKGLLSKAIDLLDRMRSAFWLISQFNEYRRVMDELIATGVEMFPENDASTPVAVVEVRVQDLTSKGELHEAIRLAALHRTALEGEADRLRLALALDNEGDVRKLATDYEGAFDCWKRCAGLFEEAGYPRHAAWIESKLISADRYLGRFAEARARRQIALNRARELGDDNSVGIYLKMYAVDALERREFDEAIRLAEAAVAALRRTGETVTLSHALVVLANTQLASNDRDAARAALQEAQLLEPFPDDEYRVRQSVLARQIEGNANGRLYFDDLVAEH